jgi:hypothetical protein
VAVAVGVAVGVGVSHGVAVGVGVGVPHGSLPIICSVIFSSTGSIVVWFPPVAKMLSSSMGVP